MKNFLLLILAAILLPLKGYSSASESVAHPDILMYGRLDSQASTNTVKRLRTLFTNQGILDPFSMKFDRALHWVLPISDLDDSKGRQYFVDAARAFDLDFDSARIVLVLDQFEHHIDKVKSSMSASQLSSESILLDVKGAVGDIKVQASQMRVMLKMVARGKTQDELCYLPPELRETELRNQAQKLNRKRAMPLCDESGKTMVTLFNINVAKPVIKTRPGAFLPFNFKTRVDVKDQFGIDILESSFEETYQQVMSDSGILNLGQLEMQNVPSITLGVGHHRFTLPAQDLRDFIRSQDTNLKGALIRVLMDGVRSSIGSSLVELLEFERLRREIWVSDSLMSGFDTRKISILDSERVEFQIDGHFCSPEEFQRVGFECYSNRNYRDIYESKWTSENLAESKKLAGDLVRNPENQLMISVSEGYVNRLLYETVEMGFWKSLLEESGARLGPKKAFILLKGRGSQVQLVMDILYPVPKLYRPLLGKKDIRFPLIFNVETFFGSSSRKLGGRSVVDPVFNVKLGTAVLDAPSLIRGLPEDGIPSHLGRMFRKKVAKMIIKKVQPFDGQEIPLVTLPGLSGMGLEGKRVMSDGNGRAIITLSQD